MQIHTSDIAKDITNNIKNKYNIDLGVLNVMFSTDNMEDLPDEYKFCPNCGIKVQVGKFCPNCGVKVGE